MIAHRSAEDMARSLVTPALTAARAGMSGAGIKRFHKESMK
jgi:hypothetical protein